MKRVQALSTLVFISILSCGEGGSTRVLENQGRSNVSGILSDVFVEASTLRDSHGRLSRLPSSGTITDVMAVSVSDSKLERVITSLDAEGGFSLDLSGPSLWVLLFIDRTRVSSEMVLGVLRTNDLDTLPLSMGVKNVNLGTITIDPETARARSSRKHEELIRDLGLTASLADLIASHDDVMLRHLNPDVNSDGELDILNEDHQFMLQIEPQYKMNPDESLQYEGGFISVSYPETFSADRGGRLRFIHSAVKTKEFGFLAKNTQTSAVTAQNIEGVFGFGTTLTLDSELPTGEVEFLLSSSRLVFHHLESPSVENLKLGAGVVRPAFKFISTGNKISGVQFHWAQYVEGIWAPLSLAELALLIDTKGAELSFSTKEGKKIHFVIPALEPQGALVWSRANTSKLDISEAEFMSLSETDLIDLEVTVQSRFGLRYRIKAGTHI